MAERQSAALAIAGRPGNTSGNVSLLSQSLPCKPRSLARIVPNEMEPPPLELPEATPPASDPILSEDAGGRTLIRFSAVITAEEFGSSPAQREVYLSQSCPTWSTFQMPSTTVDFAPRVAPAEEATPGAMAVPGNMAVESVVESEGIIGASPTILESFKMYNAGVDETEFSKISLEEIVEEPMAMPEDEGDDEDQFSLEA